LIDVKLSIKCQIYPKRQRGSTNRRLFFNLY